MSIPVTWPLGASRSWPWQASSTSQGLVLLAADQGVLAVGAEAAVSSGLASGAGEVVVAAGSAVLGPSARLEVPAAEGPDPFFAAFSSTWRSVNSWKNRSPTG
jgi:hypothetical protein